MGKNRTFVQYTNKEQESDMAENERLFPYREDALRYGTYMGLFWIVKFSFFLIGFSVPLLHLLFVLCTLLVPVLGYLFVYKYRKTYNEGDFGFAKAFGFTFVMYVAAILLVAIAHYVYFQYIDHGYFLGCYQLQVQEMLRVYKNLDSQLLDVLNQTSNQISALTPLQIVCQLMNQNIFFSVLFALFTALFTMRRTPRA